ncbi:MAG: M56 family metallopeptidase [Mariniblastus sp.]
MFETIQTASTWITWTILHFVWMGFAIWFMAQGFRFLFPSTRPMKLYRANLLGLLALIGCLPIAAIFGAWHLESDNLDRQQTAYSRDVLDVDSETKSTTEEIPTDEPTEEVFSGQKAATIANDSDTLPAEQPEPAGVAAPDLAATSASLNETVAKLSPLIAIGYLCGMVLMMFRLMLMVVGCRRIKNEAFTDQNTILSNRLTEVADRLGIRIPAFRLTARVSSPMVVGLLKPMLLMPASLISGMTMAELDAVLIHELAHLKRHDHFVVILQRVAEAIFFFHPAVWYFSRGLSQTRELCCDDIVLAQGTQPLDYARGLCHVAEFSQNKKAPEIALAASGESPSELLGRVRRVLGDSGNAKIGPSRFAALTIATLILAPVVAISAFAISPPVNVELINSMRSLPPQEQTQIQKDSFVVKGRVLDQSGNPVAGASLRGAQALNMHLHATANENGEFQIDFPHEFDAMIIAYSPDRKTVAAVKTNRELAAAKPVELKLASGIEHIVTVTKDGQSVSDAVVWCRTTDYPFTIGEEKTGSNGTVSLLLPAGVKTAMMMSWHETMGVCAASASKGSSSRERVTAGADVYVVDPTTVSESRSDPSIGDPQSSDSSNESKSRVFEMALLPTRTCKVIVLDENDKPVSDIAVSTLLTGRGDNKKFLNILPPTNKKTNANGEVEFHWIPPAKDYDFRPGVFGNKKFSWNQMRTLKSNSPSNELYRVYVNRFANKKTVKGRLVGGKGDLKNIRVSGRGYKDDMSDYFESFTNSKGEFEIDLVPGMMYSIGVTNDYWASNVGKVQAGEGSEFSLDIYPATPITVTLTSGKNKTPVTTGGVQFVINAKTRGIHPVSVRGDKRFNENGQLVFGAPSGNIKLRIMAEGWNLDRQVRVQRGKPQNLVLHAPAIGMRTVTGKITGPAGIELGNCEVRIKDQYQHRDWSPVKTKSDGSWSAEVDSQQVGVTVFTTDKKFGGIGFKKELGETMSTIKLRPTVTVSGVLFDEDGKPMKNMELCQFYDNNPMFGQSNKLDYLSTRTDDDGAFEFKGVITGVPQKLCLKKTAGSYSYIGNSKVYNPSEDTTGIRATYIDYARRERERRGAKRMPANITPKPVTLAERLRLMAAKCKAESMHGLVMISPADLEVKKIVDSLTEIPLVEPEEVEPGKELNPFEFPFVHFLPRGLTDSSKTTKASLDHLASLNIERPIGKQLVCFIIDGAGEKIDSQTFDTTQKDVKATFDEFLTRNMPEKRDARKQYKSALARAAKEGKNVFVKIGGPRCSPCLEMGVWLDQHHSVFEKDYVMFSFHPGRCIGGRKLALELCKNFGGVPWFTILDKDGNELISSDGPLGNIGFPAGHDESINHFISMLEKSRKNLTDEDLLTLRRSLKSDE